MCFSGSRLKKLAVLYESAMYRICCAKQYTFLCI